MPISKQGGFITFALIATVLIGLGATSYLVLKPAIFAPKAAEKVTEVSTPTTFPQTIESSDSSKLTSPSPSITPMLSPLPTKMPVITTPLPSIKQTVTPTPSAKPTPISSSTPVPTPIPTLRPSTATATLSLNPSTATFKKGCSYSIAVQVDTAGKSTDGTDVVLDFDTSRLTITSIQPGSIYKEYPPSSINNQSGKTIFSGLSEIGNYFNGQGILATVNFTVKSEAPEGTAQIKFDFDSSNKSKTIDSNIVERGSVVDVLDSVIDGSYTIGSGPC